MIAGGGFAMMAWKLALTRAELDADWASATYLPERMTDPCNDSNCEHCSYYRIIDRARLAFSTRSLPPICDTVNL